MRDTPVPGSGLEPDRLRTAAALQRAREALLVKPRPLAPDVAQGVLFPLLQALGVDIFDLRTLRLAAPAEGERASYLLLRPGDRCRIEVLSAGQRLPALTAPSDEVDWSLCSNGRQWRAQTGNGSDGFEFELLDQGFAQALAALLEPTGDPAARLDRAAELLEAEGAGNFSPFERISLAEVRRHAEQVRHLHGKLEARFEGELVEVTSRSAFYYVLAALALSHGREDAIPPDDLVRPPDEPPDLSRARPLGRPGWHLLLDLDPAEIEERTRSLLAALGLQDTFAAALRGAPYPSRP